MKRYDLNRVIAFFIWGIIPLYLFGCSSALQYTGTAGIDKSKMTPQQKGSINVLIPPGYIEDAKLESSEQDDLIFKTLGANPNIMALMKKNSSAAIMVFCWDGLTFVPNNKLDEIARNLVNSNLVEAKLVAGTYEFGSGFFKMLFEKYSGFKVIKGKNVPWTAWIAWRGTAGLDCKYVIFGTTQGDSSDFENDFVSFIRNID